jgi:O-antigen/teichoic acid export membrane protein
MINELVKKYKKNPLIKDNIILFIGNITMGFFAFLYHFYMGRVLGPADYAVVGAIMSLAYLLNISLTTIQTSISNFAANFKAKNKFEEINYLLRSSTKRLFMFGFLFLILFLALSPFLASYLKLKFFHLLLFSPFIILVVLLPIVRGALQGLQKFKDLGLNLVWEGTSKLFLGIIFVVIGFGVNGAIGAMVLSYLIPFFIGFYPLKNLLIKKIKKFNTKDVYKYSIPVLLMLVGLTALYSIDVLLVKHFFTDKEAGYYTAISTLGKILFFGSYSITQVMFPKVSELYIKKKPHKHILYKSLLMMLIFLIPLTLLYFLFSGFILNTVYGKDYLGVSGLLGLFAVIMTLFSLVYTIAFYNLSINKTRFLFIIFFFNVLEIILIYLFHNTLMQIVFISLILMILLFIILFLQAIISKDGKIINNHTSV